MLPARGSVGVCTPGTMHRHNVLYIQVGSLSTVYYYTIKKEKTYQNPLNLNHGNLGSSLRGDNDFLHGTRLLFKKISLQTPLALLDGSEILRRCPQE